MQKLSEHVISHLRSDVAITTVNQCVTELVQNSIDAKSTNIAVRINLTNSLRIQVVDNGIGMKKDELCLVSNRYTTSKCSNLGDLSSSTKYGYRGEALASIREMAGSVDISSRKRSTTSTYRVLFRNGTRESVTITDHRPSCGTTVTVSDLFASRPVRRKVVNSVLELENICESLQAFGIIHPDVSVSLRDDSMNSMVLLMKRATSVESRFVQLFPVVKIDDLVDVIYDENGFCIKGFIGRNLCTTGTLQFVYVNGRYVVRSRVHKLLTSMLQNNRKDKRADVENATKSEPHLVFMVDVKCERNAYDITFEPAKTLVEFENWDSLKLVICNAVENVHDKLTFCMNFKDNNTKDTDVKRDCNFVPVEISMDTVTSLTSKLIKRPLVNTEMENHNVLTVDNDNNVNEDTMNDNVDDKINQFVQKHKTIDDSDVFSILDDNFSGSNTGKTSAEESSELNNQHKKQLPVPHSVEHTPHSNEDANLHYSLIAEISQLENVSVNSEIKFHAVNNQNGGDVNDQNVQGKPSRIQNVLLRYRTTSDNQPDTLGGETTTGSLNIEKKDHTNIKIPVGSSMTKFRKTFECKEVINTDKGKNNFDDLCNTNTNVLNKPINNQQTSNSNNNNCIIETISDDLTKKRYTDANADNFNKPQNYQRVYAKRIQERDKQINNYQQNSKKIIDDLSVRKENRDMHSYGDFMHSNVKHNFKYRPPPKMLSSSSFIVTPRSGFKLARKRKYDKHRMLLNCDYQEKSPCCKYKHLNTHEELNHTDLPTFNISDMYRTNYYDDLLDNNSNSTQTPLQSDKLNTMLHNRKTVRCHLTDRFDDFSYTDCDRSDRCDSDIPRFIEKDIADFQHLRASQIFASYKDKYKLVAKPNDYYRLNHRTNNAAHYKTQNPRSRGNVIQSEERCSNINLSQSQGFKASPIFKESQGFSITSRREESDVQQFTFGQSQTLSPYFMNDGRDGDKQRYEAIDKQYSYNTKSTSSMNDGESHKSHCDHDCGVNCDVNCGLMDLITAMETDEDSNEVEHHPPAQSVNAFEEHSLVQNENAFGEYSPNRWETEVMNNTTHSPFQKRNLTDQAKVRKSFIETNTSLTHETVMSDMTDIDHNSITPKQKQILVPSQYSTAQIEDNNDMDVDSIHCSDTHHPVTHDHTTNAIKDSITSSALNVSNDEYNNCSIAIKDSEHKHHEKTSDSVHTVQVEDFSQYGSEVDVFQCAHKTELSQDFEEMELLDIKQANSDHENSCNIVLQTTDMQQNLKSLDKLNSDENIMPHGQNGNIGTNDQHKTTCSKNTAILSDLFQSNDLQDRDSANCEKDIFVTDNTPVMDDINVLTDNKLDDNFLNDNENKPITDNNTLICNKSVTENDQNKYHIDVRDKENDNKDNEENDFGNSESVTQEDSNFDTDNDTSSQDTIIFREDQDNVSLHPSFDSENSDFDFPSPVNSVADSVDDNMITLSRSVNSVGSPNAGISNNDIKDNAICRFEQTSIDPCSTNVAALVATTNSTKDSTSYCTIAACTKSSNTCNMDTLEEASSFLSQNSNNENKLIPHSLSQNCSDENKLKADNLSHNTNNENTLITDDLSQNSNNESKSITDSDREIISLKLDNHGKVITDSENEAMNMLVNSSELCDSSQHKNTVSERNISKDLQTSATLKCVTPLTHDTSVQAESLYSSKESGKKSGKESLQLYHDIIDITNNPTGNKLTQNSGKNEDMKNSQDSILVYDTTTDNSGCSNNHEQSSEENGINVVMDSCDDSFIVENDDGGKNLGQDLGHTLPDVAQVLGQVNNAVAETARDDGHVLKHNWRGNTSGKRNIDNMIVDVLNYSRNFRGKSGNNVSANGNVTLSQSVSEYVIVKKCKTVSDDISDQVMGMTSGDVTDNLMKTVSRDVNNPIVENEHTGDVGEMENCDNVTMNRHNQTNCTDVIIEKKSAVVMGNGVHVPTKLTTRPKNLETSKDGDVRLVEIQDALTGGALFINPVTGCTVSSDLVTEMVGNRKAHDDLVQMVIDQAKKSSPYNPAKTPDDKMVCMLHQHNLNDSSDDKWRDGHPDTDQDSVKLIASGENTTSLADLLSSWTNPIFTVPHEDVMSVEAREVCPTANVLRVSQSMRFTKAMLPSFQVIGQVDNKFVACVCTSQPLNISTGTCLLVFVDQHAAHERVRLERLIQDMWYGNNGYPLTTRLSPPVSLSLSDDHSRVVTGFADLLHNIGLDIDGSNEVTSAPTCLFTTAQGKEPSLDEDILQTFLLEEIEYIRRCGRALTSVPKTVNDILSSQACHGAIKFGDPLSLRQCEDLICDLLKTNLPFQCAHGRPTMVPILDVSQAQALYSQQDEPKPDLSKLKAQWLKCQHNHRPTDNT